MSVEVATAIDQLVKQGAIAADQSADVMKIFLEFQSLLRGSDAYKMLEPIRKSIPPEMLKFGSLTYEEGLVLAWAAQASNIKRAGSFFKI